MSPGVGGQLQELRASHGRSVLPPRAGSAVKGRTRGVKTQKAKSVPLRDPETGRQGTDEEIEEHFCQPTGESCGSWCGNSAGQCGVRVREHAAH